MKRRHAIRACLATLCLCHAAKLFAHPDDVKPLRLSEQGWLQKLRVEQYDVLRLGGTEPAGSSPLNFEIGQGVYHCAGCYLALFDSEWKYDSGTGWPSFWKVLAGHVVEQKMNSALRAPIEYLCAQCGGHQGHVFADGPMPTGLRYCNNGIALQFKAIK